MEHEQFVTFLIALGAMFLTSIGVTVALFLWNRSESNADRRDIMTVIREIQTEMKDFHSRLLIIEERNRK